MARRKKRKEKKLLDEVQLAEEILNQLKAVEPKMVTAGPHLPYGNLFDFSRPLSFLDANIGLLPFGTNEQELSYLARMSRAFLSPCETPKTGISLDDIARKVISEETTFDLTKYDLKLSFEGARGAMVTYLQHLVSADKPLVVYTSPNWIFDKIVSHVDGALSFTIHATTADEFVDKFAALEVSTKDRIAAVMIVDPANPLGYRFTPGQIVAIEEIAQQHGIVPIFDDVFRGLQDKGNRHSSSEYSHNSIIIETTSKRFGARSLGVTWSLVPRSSKIGYVSPIDSECVGCTNLATVVIEGLYNTDYGEKVRSMLQTNSRAFQRGFKDSFGEQQAPGRFVQAFPTMPLFTYHFDSEFWNPEDPFKVAAFKSHLAQANVRVSYGIDWICSPDSKFKLVLGGKDGKADLEIDKTHLPEIIHALRYLRICPTKTTPEMSYVGGQMMGSKFQHFFK
ncbi:MAG TPA: aminotransferase class I/II-fold pyridoxal phosphate-dependent enzyme [Candidatus Nanoarchaeia archaeon]|nr:aminotransferase class I/II-fold pyridoxal phosphate-dependent enzyme [Candidatus Nanoarchaeia archaeon]